MENHSLLKEFPEHQERIHELKTSNPRFKRFFDEYEDLNHTIHGVESTGVYEDTSLNTLRGLRVKLKDILYDMIKNPE